MNGSIPTEQFGRFLDRSGAFEPPRLRIRYAITPEEEEEEGIQANATKTGMNAFQLCHRALLKMTSFHNPDQNIQPDQYGCDTETDEHGHRRVTIKLAHFRIKFNLKEFRVEQRPKSDVSCVSSIFSTSFWASFTFKR